MRESHCISSDYFNNCILKAVIIRDQEWKLHTYHPKIITLETGLLTVRINQKWWIKKIVHSCFYHQFISVWHWNYCRASFTTNYSHNADNSRGRFSKPHGPCFLMEDFSARPELQLHQKAVVHLGKKVTKQKWLHVESPAHVLETFKS